MKYLKVQHDSNQLAAVRGWQTTPLMQDCFQLRTWQFLKVQFYKPIPKGSRKHLGKAEEKKNMIKRAFSVNFQNGASAIYYKKKNPSKVEKKKPKTSSFKKIYYSMQ